MEFDVVIVGAGPAGLAAAIRLRQVAAARGADLSVCVLEKGARVGDHILSGNVFEPRALDELLPDWRERGAPVSVKVTQESFMMLTKGHAFKLPTPPQLRNEGNFIISLSELVTWLGEQAEAAGVDVFPGFAAAELLYDGGRGGAGAVCGVATGDAGVGRDGCLRPRFQRGMELRARVTLLAEGCRGSLSEEAISRFRLREQVGAQHQTYALGVKEVWRLDPACHHEGSVLHTLGFPAAQRGAYGGGFIYHMGGGLAAVGHVLGLDYRNPFLSPAAEFNEWKRHPLVRSVLDGGECLQYGARALNEGGLQSVPGLTFPGGALVGCAAGFLNVPKIKGSHTAIKTGMLAAEAAADALLIGGDGPVDLAAYQEAVRSSWVWEELRRARNIRPGFKHGLAAGLVNSAIDTYLLRGRAPWTLRHGEPDHAATEPATAHAPPAYAKPDGVITFDIPTSLYRSGTNHEDDQPPHLRLRNPTVPETVNWPVYAGPESRFCPARVYEYEAVDASVGGREATAASGAAGPAMRLRINAQNCLHCKACDIKDPSLNIRWTVPEGGGGPQYTLM